MVWGAVASPAGLWGGPKQQLVGLLAAGSEVEHQGFPGFTGIHWGLGISEGVLPVVALTTAAAIGGLSDLFSQFRAHKVQA